VALLAVKFVALPEHMVGEAANTDTTGGALTVITTVTGVDGAQPEAVPFKVYVVVTVGLAVTLAPVDELKEELGVQV